MKNLFKAVLATAAIPITWGLLTTESLAASFNVSIGSSTFQINAFSDTSKTLSQLYDYVNYSYDQNGTGSAIIDSSELSPGTSHFFFVDAIDGLGLFMVHDQPGSDATGGLIRTTFDTTASKGDFAVLDDPIDSYTINTSDESGGFLSSLVAYQGWKNPFTDGVALKWDNFGNNPSLTAKFTDFRTGSDFGIPIGDWDIAFLTNAGNNTAFSRDFAFALNQDITFTPESSSSSSDDFDELALTSSSVSSSSVSSFSVSSFSVSDEFGTQDVGITQTPEPSTLLGLFLISGLGGLVCRKKA